MTDLFIWARKTSPSWKWLYYEALVRWQHNQVESARELFRSCGTEPGFAPFYLTKAELFRDDPTVVEASLVQATRLDPSDWRALQALSKFYVREDRNAEALIISGRNHKLHPASFAVGLQYAQMLRLNGRYKSALDVLGSLNMLPAEGDVDAHTLYRETNILYALQFMKTGKWQRAVLQLREAETWPENLFSGEPYLPDNRLTRFFMAYCYDRLNDPQQEAWMFNYIKNYENPDGYTSRVGNHISRFVRAGEQDYDAIAATLLKEEEKDVDSVLIKAFMETLP